MTKNQPWTPWADLEAERLSLIAALQGIESELPRDLNLSVPGNPVSISGGRIFVGPFRLADRAADELARHSVDLLRLLGRPMEDILRATLDDIDVAECLLSLKR